VLIPAGVRCGSDEEMGVVHAEGSFRNKDGARIYYQHWRPEGEPKAVLLVVHGLPEHSGRYLNIVNHFVPRGYGVYGIDHLGHGRSDGTRVHVDRFSDLIEPVEIYFDMIRSWHPGRPVFMIGHSMGGLITSVFLLDHQDECSGAILSAPAVKVSESISRFAIFTGKLLSKLTPKAGLLALDATAISKDPMVVKAYLDDPLVHTGRVTARLASEILGAMQRVSTEAATLRLPMLLIQGSRDRLVDPGGAQMLYAQAASIDKTIKVYDGLFHEVFNEPERAVVLRDVEAWLDAHLG
jgi:acylglycerol lipase